MPLAGFREASGRHSGGLREASGRPAGGFREGGKIARRIRQNRRILFGNRRDKIAGRAGSGQAGSGRKRKFVTDPVPNAPRKKIRRSGVPHPSLRFSNVYDKILSKLLYDFYIFSGKDVQRRTRTDKDGQRQIKTDKDGQRRTDADKDGQRRTKADRRGQGLTDAGRDGQ